MKHLAISLSQFESPTTHVQDLEQWDLSGDLAARWLDGLRKEVSNRTVFDLCAGNGILGLGALAIGASSVVLVDIDHERSRCSVRNAGRLNAKVIQISSSWEELGLRPEIQNLEEGAVVVATCHIDQPAEWTSDSSVVIMNPPFGTSIRGSDRIPIEAACAMKPRLIEIMHSRQANHVESLILSNGYSTERRFNAKFELPRQADYHNSERSQTDVSVWRCMPQKSML